MSERIRLSDGSSWPRPCMESDERPLNWAARWSTLTRSETLQLASIAEAYGELVCNTTQKRRDQVVREMREELNGE